MKINKDKNKQISYYLVHNISHDTSSTKQYVRSVVTYDQEFEDQLNDLMSCSNYQDQLEYI